MKSASLKALFESPKAYASPLLIACVDRFGLECFEWEPETLRAGIRNLGANIIQRNMDKLQALITTMTTNLFYVSFEGFVHICNGLCGSGCDFRTYDPADVDEMCWAITEVMLNDPDTFQNTTNDQVFSKEIRIYMTEKAREEGLARLPSPLSKFSVAPERLDPMKDSFGMNDANLFAATFSTEQDRVSEFEDIVKVNLNNMLTQIDAMELLKADEESWKKFSGRGFANLRKGSGGQSIQALLPEIPQKGRILSSAL